MFQINPDPTFVGTVKIPAAGGKEQELRLVFKHKTRDEAKEYFQRATDSDASDTKLLLEVIAGWEDVDAEFSEEALNRLIQNYQAAPRAIFEGYLAELQVARLGN
ncbi:phage tail assembly chaperone [Cupriavidus basilensis]|uniref:Phage tail assembly chaperone n=1 Tax=Cupriavidus basilensis TaxID=68895 RepID=A0ABT6AX44_9BURK|nr:phage tail assembly chaperone [Cupriavidus basilensis]MDF3837153.1 phage tail assembly chaperone [Cupriavidus basilensis]